VAAGNAEQAVADVGAHPASRYSRIATTRSCGRSSPAGSSPWSWDPRPDSDAAGGEGRWRWRIIGSGRRWRRPIRSV